MSIGHLTRDFITNITDKKLKYSFSVSDIYRKHPNRIPNLLKWAMYTTDGICRQKTNNYERIAVSEWVIDWPEKE